MSQCEHLFVRQGCKTLGFLQRTVCRSMRENSCLRRHLQRPRHWNYAAAAVNHPQLCFSRFRRRFVVVIFGLRVLFSVSRFFFFLLPSGRFAHKSCLFCLLLSSLRQQVCCQQKWGAPALGLLQQRLFCEPGQSGAQAKRAIQLAA